MHAAANSAARRNEDGCILTVTSVRAYGTTDLDRRLIEKQLRGCLTRTVVSVRRVIPALCALAGALVLVGSVQARASGVSCHAINATGVGQDLGNGMTRAQISNGGLLQGTTRASFVITGFSGSVASIAGTVVFTVNRATVSVGVAGTFDVSSGAFSASGPITAATGKLAGATGTLSLAGVEDLTNGSFTENVTGTVCADLEP
jgi:hypothetical protein